MINHLTYAASKKMQVTKLETKANVLNTLKQNKTQKENTAYYKETGGPCSLLVIIVTKAKRVWRLVNSKKEKLYLTPKTIKRNIVPLQSASH